MKKIFVLMLFLGFLLRIAFINSSPPSLYGDELTITLDAYSLLKTGHDQLGNFLPLTFPMGAGRPAGYVYFSVPFMALFGPTALGVRALSVLSGVGIIFLLYLLCRRLFSEKLALLAAALTAISPWDISLSRGGFEAHFALFLALLGAYLFLKAKEKPIFYLLSAVSFGLTLHTYPTYKITLPLFLILLVWFVKPAKKQLFGGLIILIFLAAISFSQTFVGGSETRFFSINVFSQDKLNSEIEQKINMERSVTQLPAPLARYFHNKPVEYAKVLGENYLQNFSADFLFIHGDRNPRHNMATIGEFYFAEVILILIGLLSFWKSHRKIMSYIIFWIILSPLATAIIGDPHALRSALIFPPLEILSALGLLTFFDQKNKLALVVISLLFFIQFAFFLQKLYFLAPKEYSNFWAYTAKLASEKAQQDKNKFDYIFLSDKIDSIEFAYPVYAKIDPAVVIAQNKNGVEVAGHNFKKFDNVYIGYIADNEVENVLKQINGKELLVKPDNLNNSIKTQTN